MCTLLKFILSFVLTGKGSSRFLVLVTCSLMALSFPGTAQDEDNLFDYWKYYSDAENTLYKTSCTLAFEQLHQREADLANLRTESDFLARQQMVKSKLTRLIGPLPPKTPLNAQITGVIKKDDFKVEKILFESMPGYYVTAALFLPVPRKGKLPVIIYASGHTENGFRSETYQHIIINLVKKGFAVFAFDPVGQGERWQYFNQDNTRRFNGTTIEHSYPGVQCYISGYSPTNYFVWDGIRSVDYLLTRKEIDPDRIGMTGRSGGGTQTAYTAALDHRILAAAPECFITKMEYILKSIGPQDAEQNLYRMIYEGLDHADLLEVRAPKPTLMIATTRDFFSIQGVHETFTEAKRFYQGLQAGDQMMLAEDDDVHKSTRKNREAMYAFFQKHLKLPGDSKDLEVEVFTEQELWVTASGKVSDLQSKTLFDLNQSQVEQQLQALQENRELMSDLKTLKGTVKELSGFEPPTGPVESIFTGRTQESTYILEKYLVSGDRQYQIPLYFYKSKATRSGKLVLIFSDKGIRAVNNGDLVESLIKQGHDVLTADLPGAGSLGPGYLKGDAYVDNTSFNQWFAGILTGKSQVAIRAEDIISVTEFAKSQLAYTQGISAISLGAFGSDLLHAALFEEDIESIGMINPFASYAEIATTPQYLPSLIPSVVAGAINSYDLPDLLAAMNPRPVLVLNPLDPRGMKYQDQRIMDLLSYPEQAYQQSNDSKNLRVINGLSDSKVSTTFSDWLNDTPGK